MNERLSSLYYKFLIYVKKWQDFFKRKITQITEPSKTMKEQQIARKSDIKCKNNRQSRRSHAPKHNLQQENKKGL